jgi:hypothetical protein
LLSKAFGKLYVTRLICSIDIGRYGGFMIIIGVPKEVKDNEYRVGITPGGVRQLAGAGCQVLVETVAEALGLGKK